MPASVLEADVLPARVRGYRPADLDALCTAGEVVWVGAGPLGATDGRVRLVLPRPGRAARCRRPTGRAAVGSACTTRSATTSRHGARRSGPSCRGGAEAERPTTTPSVLAALWDLVWAGEVTNDSLAPLRARCSPASPTSARGADAEAGRGPAGSRGSGHPRAPAGGRSSRRCSLPAAPTSTEVAHAAALQLLERYGVLTREAALGEGVEGGFAGVYPVLKALEERGQVRRGYFVAGARRGPVRVARRRRPPPRDREPAEGERAARRSRPPIRRSPTAPRCRGPHQGVARPVPRDRW